MKTLIDNLPIWTSAMIKKNNVGRGSGNGKQSAYGIKKLRELILDLAVRGKLVPQDPNDEPASKLLEKIEADPSTLRQAQSKQLRGRSSKQNPLPEIADDEKPFDLPKGWEWFRIGNYFDFQYGKALKAEERNETGNVNVYGSNGIVGKHNTALSNEPCIVIGRKGSAGALNKAYEPSWTTDVAYYFIPPNGFYFDFTFELLKSLNIEDLGKGIKPGINRNEVYLKIAALPPLAEQKRIVAKVDELMALCDRLEEKQNENQATHENLVETLLGSLTAPDHIKNQKEFIANWRRVSQNFATVFTSEASIEKLKSTILQLAVMGKLVEQDSSDEPASKLLEKIAGEKEKLIADGKIKKQKPLPEITDEEKPFELPEGWVWVRLGEISNLITKGSSPKWQGVEYTKNSDDILFITSENVGSYKLIIESKKYVEKKFNEIEPRSILQKGDFLMNIVGASIGRTAIFTLPEIANINQAVCLIRIDTDLLVKIFLLHFFNSEICISYMFDKQVDNARANLSMGNISNFLIPLPPLAEQKRIVDKVDELMAICDSLKEKIAQNRATAVKLADAVVGVG